MNQQQSLLHSLSYNSKEKLIWTASYDSLQRLVAEYLNLHEGSWRCPGGDGKLFESEDVSIKWYEGSQTVTVSGESKTEIEEKLKTAARISKDLSRNDVINNEDSKARSHSPAKSMTDADDPLETIKEFVNCKLLVITKEFNGSFEIVNNKLQEYSNELKKFITQDSESKLQALRKENLELKKENGSLTERINNLSYILADLQDKVKNAQEEKASLITSIRLLYKDVEVNHPLKDNDLSQVTNNNHVEVNHSLNDNDIELQQQNKSAEANHPLKDNDQLQVTNNHVDVNDPLNDNDIELQQPRNTASTSETTSNQSNTSANQVNQHNSTKIAVINDNRKMNQPVSKHLIPCPFQRRGFCKKGRLCDFLHIDFKPPNFMHQPSKTSHASYANPRQYAESPTQHRRVPLLGHTYPFVPQFNEKQSVAYPFLSSNPPIRSPYPPPLMIIPTWPPFPHQ